MLTRTHHRMIDGPVYGIHDFATLAQAVADIGATPALLIVDRVTSLGSNLAIPDTLRLLFLADGRIDVSGGATLTVNSHIDASPLQQIFGGAGTAQPKANAELPVHWWGASESASADDNDTAIQATMDAGKALQAGERGAVIWFGPFKYKYKNLVINHRDYTGMTFKGQGPNLTQLQAHTTAGDSFTITGTDTGGGLAAEPITTSVQHITFRDLRFEGGNASPGVNGFYIAHAQRISFERNVRIAQFPQLGVKLERPAHCAYIYFGPFVWISSNGTWGIQSVGSKRISDVTVWRAAVTGNGSGNIDIGADDLVVGSSNISFAPIGIRLAGDGGAGPGCSGWILFANRYEGNTTNSILAASTNNEPGLIFGGRLFSGGDDPAIDVNNVTGAWLLGLSFAGYAGGDRLIRLGTGAANCVYQATGTGTLIDNGSNNRDADEVARPVNQGNLDTATGSTSGSLTAGSNVNIVLNPYSFFPMIQGDNADLSVRGHTIAATADDPRLNLVNTGGAGRNYDVKHRYVVA